MNTDSFLQGVELKIKMNIDYVINLRNERSMKSDLSFVTEGDLLINNIIEEAAKELGENVVVVSEEKINMAIVDMGGYIIVVDPIDGTENFTSGLPMWGVSVSCFYNGKHTGSLLGCPEMNLWIKSGNTVPQFYSRIRGLSSSLKMDELIKATQGHEYRILGCCVYNMMSVIRGSFLSFENPKGANSWDILGGINLALEHNLKVIVNDKPYSGQYLPADQKYRFWVGR
jgi:fructose-1,6-bisphosphatase/inositol monophosphatase family enzyme